MTTTTTQLYQQYTQKMQRIADVRNAIAVLQWDQETYLPPKGGALRGQQISTLSELAHNLFTDAEMGGLLQDLLAKENLEEQAKRNVTLTYEDYEKNKKYPSSFVRQMSEQTNKAFHAWIEARKENSFAFYQTELDALVQLKREEASLLGYQQHPYNALLHEYEKGATVALLDKTFDQLLPSLQKLLTAIEAKPQVDDSFLKQSFPKQAQWNWGMGLLKSLGFDFEAGRQDVSEHPFSVSFNTNDVRITTRIDEQDFSNMTWSCIHEAGHALYEQGLPAEQYGLPLGEACSYSIHESQSRLWENNVGRALPFWQYYYPQLQQQFPQQFGAMSLQQFYKAINKVQPSLVRTEADEITYHFHVYIRYLLEKQLIEGNLQTKDIPAFWHEQYKKLLNVTVPDDKRGPLQDVHWSHGSFGYFPTYSLGSFYATQLYTHACQTIPDVETALSNGNVAPLLLWLRLQVHAKGRFYTSEDLCKNVTGQSLNVQFFVDYLLRKYAAIYDL